MTSNIDFSRIQSREQQQIQDRELMRELLQINQWEVESMRNEYQYMQVEHFMEWENIWNLVNNNIKHKPKEIKIIIQKSTNMNKTNENEIV
ncbi:unnamed protein product [Didymodactylos carnosus]|uniref:Uncharacterized protein n=1 Tax=Didymodactylos carnosus TaxID=1234261 RepID=A0A8S2G2J4_9BILA|nr:unnamed protein product [Didymodactylos carnosus]CAF4416693.1 unnamed protein product [Didymodactylos carnosus]